MKKVYFVLILIVFGSTTAWAQQDPQFSQNIFTKLAVNPGFAGANGAYCGTLLYRNQWTGFGGEPKTMLFTGDAYIDDISSGVGLTVISDQLGFDKNLGIRAAYAYRTQLGSGKLGIGADFGLMQKSIDGSKFIYNDGPDASIPTNNVSGGTFDLGFGLYYNTDKMFVGASASHLTEGEIKYSNIKTKLARHYYLQGGYSVGLTSSLDLKPSLLVKTDGASTQMDINANLVINNKYWGGLSYRLQDAIVIMVGMEIIPNLKFGYSYDLTTSDIKTYSSGTHEVMLGYCFKPVKVIHRQFHRNVRFL
ncbi:MAG: type IX secretion system membrane protein PorP/SprF [Bacteroidetes bacterium]|nr:type IX secretion system membrane protein PorP/SprF [Bacteroidota bacterium]